MKIAELFRRKKTWKDLSAEDLRREEVRLEIREAQVINRLEKLERHREDLFTRGSRVKSMARRKVLARQLEQKTFEARLEEQRLNKVSKELATLSALRLVLERRRREPEGVLRALQTMSESELVQILEDDKVSYDVYMEKLSRLGETLEEGSALAVESVGHAGAEVLKVWEQLDRGELEDVEVGLHQAESKTRKVIAREEVIE